MTQTEYVYIYAYLIHTENDHDSVVQIYRDDQNAQ